MINKNDKNDTRYNLGLWAQRAFAVGFTIDEIKGIVDDALGVEVEQLIEQEKPMKLKRTRGRANLDYVPYDTGLFAIAFDRDMELKDDNSPVVVVNVRKDKHYTVNIVQDNGKTVTVDFCATKFPFTTTLTKADFRRLK